MKYFLVAFLFVVGTALAQLRISEVRDCVPRRLKNLFDIGDEWSIVSLISGSVSPDPVPVPGVMYISLELDVLEDLPTDLTMHSNVHKVSPDHHPVHCLDGIHGSCTIHVCQLIEEQPELICPSFPADVPCACPLPAGFLNLTNVAVTYDEQWLNLDFAVTGDYTERITLTSASSPNGTLGCMELDYTLIEV